LDELAGGNGVMLAIEKSQGDLEAEQLLECHIVMAGGVTSGIIYRTNPGGKSCV
jgi:hypothetical protein